MTYRDLMNGAIAAVCEDASSAGVEDYQTRAPFLLATFVTQYAKLDDNYRAANGMENKVISTDAAAIDLEDDFPLCDIFAPAAINHLASGLVIDENEEMSDKFFDRYINIILEIRKNIPAKMESIIDRYNLT